MITCSHGDKAADIRTVGKHNAIVPNNGVIYWHIDEDYITNDFDKLKVILQFERAFGEWQPYFLPVKFQATSDRKKAAIVVHFMNPDDKALPEPFGDSTLAYAFFPQRESLGIHADMYFNDKYQWAEKHSSGEINLFKVIVHELGHAFGLHHSTDITDILYPTYQPNDSVVITRDTLEGIHELYGTGLPEEEPKAPAGELESFIKRMFATPHGVRWLSNHHVRTLAEKLGVPYYAQATRVTKARLQQRIDDL